MNPRPTPPKVKRKPGRAEKEVEMLRSLLYDLTYAAERVANKHGVEKDGTPLDWNEWANLRTAIQQAKTKGDAYRQLAGPHD